MTISSPRFQFEDVHEDVLLLNADYEHYLLDNLTLKTGARWRRAQRDNVTTQLFIGPEAGDRRVVSAGMFDDGSGGPFNAFGGQLAERFGNFIPTQPAFDFFFEDAAANIDNWEFNRSDLRDAADTAELQENIFGTYIQGTYTWEDFTLVAGVRIERTDLDTTWKPSNFVVDASNIPDLTEEQRNILSTLVTRGVEDLGFTGDASSFNFGDIVDDINRRNDYTNVLPSAVLTYRLGDTGHVFRFAWTNTLTRPDYRELVPFDLGLANAQLSDFGIIDLTNRDDEFDLGNPRLREQTSRNFDVAWEYYFGPQQRNTVSVTYFRKNLDDFLQEDTFSREVSVLVDAEDPSQGFETITSDTNFWTNASERFLQGVEFSGYFAAEDWLPSFLSFFEGLSFVPNYTFVTGSQTDPIFDETELAQGNFVVIGQREEGSLINQAKHITNLQFFYERGRLNTRVSFNYISKLQKNPSTAAIDDLTFDRLQKSLNLSVQYRLLEETDVRVFIEADNLTNNPITEEYVGNIPGLYTTGFQTDGRRIVMGVRGSL